jgi:predicted outer membrane repeat protein
MLKITYFSDTSPKIPIVIFLLLISILYPDPVFADSVITVTTNDDNTTSDGKCSLPEAITNANNDAQTFTDCVTGSGNDTILFDNTLGTATIALSSPLPTISDAEGLTIDGGSDIRISGGNSVQILNVFSGASLILQNLTVTNGRNATGGGIYNGGTLTITNAIISNNTATIHGGGIFNNGTLTITNSLFSDNSAVGAAGGIINDSGTTLVKNSTFVGNNAASAGAIYQNDTGTLTVANSTFSDNTAVNYGGGIYSTGETTMGNNTFSSNGAGISGGDIYFSTFSSPILSLYNNILANSDTSAVNCTIISGTVLGNNNLIEDSAGACGFTNGIDGNIIGLDPNLGILTGSPAYFPLNSGSPAIDTGDDAICAAALVNNTSQNGLTRPQGPACDIGSFEYKYFNIFLPLISR